MLDRRRDRRSAAVFIVGSIVLLVAACQGPIASGKGRVSGLVGGAPTSSQGNQIGPASGKTVEFVAADNGQTESTTTGSDGRYSIDVTPGDYEVRLKGYGPLQLYYGRNAKTYGQWPHIAVKLGEETKLDLIYDTGIR